MAALTLVKQKSLKALESAKSMLSGGKSKPPPPPPRLTVTTGRDSDVLLETTFFGSRLGIKLVLALTEGRTDIVVEEVVAGVGPEGLCPRDVLVAVDGGRVTVPRPDAFDAWIAKLRKRPRPLVLTFAPGAGRGAAQKKQVMRDRRLRTTAALKAFEAKDDDGEAAYNAAMLKANGIGGPKDPIAAVQLLRKAAFLDVVKAQVALGHLYRQGSSSVARNDDEAFRWYEKAALIRRDPEALYQLGKYHRDGTPSRAADVTKARECFEAAAAIGGRDAYAEALAALEADLDRQAVIDSVVQSVKSVVGTPSKQDSGGLYETLVDDETVSPFSTASRGSRDDPEPATRARSTDSRDMEYVPPTPEYMRRRGRSDSPPLGRPAPAPLLHVGRAHLLHEDRMV